MPHDHDVLTVPEAVKILRIRKPAGRKWLHEKGLVHYPFGHGHGKGRVLRQDLYNAIRGNAPHDPRSHRVPIRLRMPDL